MWPEHVREGEETGGRVLRMNKGGPPPSPGAPKRLQRKPWPPTLALLPLTPHSPQCPGGWAWVHLITHAAGLRTEGTLCVPLLEVQNTPTFGVQKPEPSLYITARSVAQE